MSPEVVDCGLLLERYHSATVRTSWLQQRSFGAVRPHDFPSIPACGARAEGATTVRGCSRAVVRIMYRALYRCVESSAMSRCVGRILRRASSIVPY